MMKKVDGNKVKQTSKSIPNIMTNNCNLNSVVSNKGSCLLVKFFDSKATTLITRK